MQPRAASATRPAFLYYVEITFILHCLPCWSEGTVWSLGFPCTYKVASIHSCGRDGQDHPHQARVELNIVQKFRPWPTSPSALVARAPSHKHKLYQSLRISKNKLPIRRKHAKAREKEKVKEEQHQHSHHFVSFGKALQRI